MWAMAVAQIVPPARGSTWDDWEDPPYAVPRGSCPRCGSGEIEHLVVGLPAGPDDHESESSWVSWVGCVHPGYDRICHGCGQTWVSGRPVDLCE